MPSFKQKNVIKSYKLRLQEKLRAVSEETQNATSFLDNCLSEFKSRVQEILEIKDEKCLTLYRKLIRDLENYSEKLFILQASLEENTEEDSESSDDEDTSSHNNESIKQPSKEVLAEHAAVENNSRTLPKESESFASVSYSQSEVHPPLSAYTQKDAAKYASYDDGNITEDDFCSLPNDIHVQNIQQSNYQVDSVKETISIEYQSSQSFSQSSCYRSLSSNISEALPISCNAGNKDKQYVQSQNDIEKACASETRKTNIYVTSPVIDVPSSVPAVFSHIIDPGDFWLQLENSNADLRFSKADYAHVSFPSFITEGTYCLAPFKTSPFYSRAKSLTSAKSGKEVVKVHFIDKGFTQDVSLCDLRPMPWSAYDIPAQAIHCCLYKVAPIQDTWSSDCIERFKDFENFCIETKVKLKKDHLYAVQLIANSPAVIEEDFSVDIAQCLCMDGFAIFKNDSSENLSNSNKDIESRFSKATFVNNSSSLEVSNSYDFNALSSDSGVSITSAKSSQKIPENKNQSSVQKKFEDSKHLMPTDNQLISSCDKKSSNSIDQKSDCDLISFTSSDALDLTKSINSSNDSSTYNCLICNTNNYCLHFTIPLPALLYVEENMMLVMLSHIENPHEFYVNMAMENILTLDELREQMTSTYETHPNVPKINIVDISENMFCAARYHVDGYWYRVKILCINKEDIIQDQAKVQYVDYGNTAVVKSYDLRPLSLQFSQPPSFAVKCSLAGVIPIEENGISNAFPSKWSQEAINAFKELTSFDRCLTAQICTDICSNIDILSVFLWDTEGSEDLLVNAALADCGMASFDRSLLSFLTAKQKLVKSDNLNAFDTWDPMAEEYYAIQNSYAVDTDEIQVATNGYQAKDEEYTCKYFSLRGFCPRGDNCPYKHLPLLEDGITRDQEEVYCLDSVPEISESMNLLVQISAIISPTHFYVVLPFGCKDVDEIDSLIYKGKSYEDILNSEAKALFDAMNEFYSSSPFNENTMIALSCGTIVAARRKWDRQWYRGRIVDVSNIDSPAKVFFVDGGDSEWVPRKFIRTILPQFLHTPFQAIQCSLHGVEPVGFKENGTWSPEVVNFFKDCVAGEILLAKFIHRFASVFHVSLRKTHENDNISIAQLLLSKGYAHFHAITTTKKRQTKYVPG